MFQEASKHEKGEVNMRKSDLILLTGGNKDKNSPLNKPETFFGRLYQLILKFVSLFTSFNILSLLKSPQAVNQPLMNESEVSIADQESDDIEIFRSCCDGLHTGEGDIPHPRREENDTPFQHVDDAEEPTNAIANVPENNNPMNLSNIQILFEAFNAEMQNNLTHAAVNMQSIASGVSLDEEELENLLLPSEGLEKEIQGPHPDSIHELDAELQFPNSTNTEDSFQNLPKSVENPLSNPRKLTVDRLPNLSKSVEEPLSNFQELVKEPLSNFPRLVKKELLNPLTSTVERLPNLLKAVEEPLQNSMLIDKQIQHFVRPSAVADFLQIPTPPPAYEVILQGNPMDSISPQVQEDIEVNAHLKQIKGNLNEKLQLLNSTNVEESLPNPTKSVKKPLPNIPKSVEKQLPNPPKLTVEPLLNLPKPVEEPLPNLRRSVEESLNNPMLQNEQTLNFIFPSALEEFSQIPSPPLVYEVILQGNPMDPLSHQDQEEFRASTDTLDDNKV